MTAARTVILDIPAAPHASSTRPRSRRLHHPVAWASSSRTSGASGRLAVIPANSVCWRSCRLAIVGARCCTWLSRHPPHRLTRRARYSLADLPLMRPDISPVGTDRAGVMRCRRSLLLAGGCCRGCQPWSDLRRTLVRRPAGSSEGGWQRCRTSTAPQISRSPPPRGP